MTIHWTYLIPALVLLWLPMPLPAKMRLDGRNHETTVPLKDMVRAWQNWADLVRAGLAAYVLLEWAITVDPTMHPRNSSAMLWQWAILTVGVLLQTIRFNRMFLFVAPVFYLCGLTVPLSGYIEGTFALFVGWLFSIAGKKMGYQLPVMAVALGIAGFVLGGLKLGVLFNCTVIFLPFILSLLFEIDLLYLHAIHRPPKPV